MKASRYNLSIPVQESVLLYNSSSGGLMSLSGPDAGALALQLCAGSAHVESDTLPDTLVPGLIEGGFLVPSHLDEVQVIRDRFLKARRETPVVLTITTTMDCNLGCYYCYEERSPDRLAAMDIQEICFLAMEKVYQSGRKSLHVDWYGGEPLLNLEFLEAASLSIQMACASQGVSYSASVISNGTVWPTEVRSFIARHRITQVQVSFDGLKRNHELRRKYRSGYKETGSDSSFDKAVALVDELVQCVHVDLRFNMDRKNLADLEPFLEMAEARGWFHAPFPAVMQPARLSAYSDRSSFVRDVGITQDQYESARETVRLKSSGKFKVEESEAPDGFPYPRTSVCAALANHSTVIGADGKQYRCGLQVGEKGRSVGTLDSRRPKGQSTSMEGDKEWWEKFDPTTLPNCSRCTFLPICWAGCPKKHLEKDEAATREQGRYWRRNLARLITTEVGIPLPHPYEFTEAQQFK